MTKLSLFHFYMGAWEMILALRNGSYDEALNDYDSVKLENWLHEIAVEVWR